jgi:hypothetical protein
MRVHFTVLIPLPADAYLNVTPVRSFRVETYDSAFRIIRRYPQIVDDPLHPAVRIVGGRQKIVE